MSNGIPCAKRCVWDNLPNMESAPGRGNLCMTIRSVGSKTGPSPPQAATRARGIRVSFGRQNTRMGVASIRSRQPAHFKSRECSLWLVGLGESESVQSGVPIWRITQGGHEKLMGGASLACWYQMG